MKPRTLILAGLTAVICALAITVVWPPNDVTVPLFFVLTIGGSVLVGWGVGEL